MRYDHMVKVNGKYYQTGEEVPETEDMAVDESSLPYSDSDIEFESKEKAYTKTDINKMNKAELLEMAMNTGVEGAEEMSRAELVEYLLSVFGL